MPRDGSSIYILPFPDVTSDTTIESPVYNGFTNDVAQDLNLPRPIVAGGTGATSAAGALAALGGETAGQIVTNYDSHVFKAGSFSSASSATSAPAAEAFAGICYMADASNYFIEARSFVNGNIYTRGKVAGVWGAWVNSEAVLDNLKVNRAGDTMTGALNITSGGLATSGPPFTSAITLNNSTGNHKKFLRMGATSELEIVNSANTTVVSTLTDSGALTTTGRISGVGVTSVNAHMYTYDSGGVTGTLQFGSSGTKYINYDGTTFNLNGAALTVGSGNVNTSANLTAVGGCYVGPTFGYHIDTYIGSGSPWQCTVMTTNPNFSNVTLTALHYSALWAGWQFQAGVSADFQFRNDSNAYKTSGGATWVIISDARIKDVRGEYTTGLDTIAALRPVRFTYKGNHSFSSPEMGAKADYDATQKAMQTSALAVEYVGLVAQEAENILPDCFKTGVGYVDGKKIEDLRNAEYTPLIFALVNAVKELKARVEELES